MPTITRCNRRAFTLAEMTVVVGLIALLTVGIGRLFAGVSDAVNRGLAVSDLDAAARALEESLRRDFARVNAMNSEDTFLVIRAIELGGDPDRPVYLTPEDREADVSEDLDPYEGGSRAIHTRLDEMAFLASSLEPLGFTSQQDAGVFTRGSARASAARVYYGHGLRPRLDPDWPLPESAPDDANTEPLRQFVSDGWFASRGGQAMDGRDYLPNGVISGRNEFASDWVLARQALLLMGPEVTGTRDPDNLNSPYAEDREYAPYIRDLETLARFWGDHLDDAPAGDDLYAWPGPVNSLVSETATPRPDQRLIAHGRVDVCAQSLRSVRGWLEGENPVWDVGGDGYSPESAPYTFDSTSAFGVTTALDQPIDDDRYGLNDDDLRDPDSATSVQRFLWRRVANNSPNDWAGGVPDDLNFLPSPNNRLEELAYNHIAIRSALAGVLTRPLIDLEPAPESRADPGTLSGLDEQIRYAQEHDASMDTHAVIAPRCSRFEIAWSDGSTWNEDVDFDLDGVFDARAGDRVWFDPTRLEPDNDPNDENADRMTYENLKDRFTGNEIVDTVLYTDPAQRLDQVNSPLGGADGVELKLNPEVGFGDADYFDTTPTFSSITADPLGSRLFVKTIGDFTPDPNNGIGANSPKPYYNPDLTGGAPSVNGWPDETPSTPSEDINEYLAIWPFHAPSSTGEWTVPFEKSVWIRVRFTLHDPQGRVPGGRDYEVILHFNPQDEQS